MTSGSNCPEQELWQRYMLGQVSGDEGELLGDHLLHCARCGKVVTALQCEDTLVQSLHGVEPFIQEAGDPVVDDLRRKLKTLPPPVPEAVLEALTAARVPPEPPATDTARELSDFLAPPREPGEIGRLGDYRVLKVLGAGGMGVVFQAEEPRLKRLVALKVLKPALAASAAARRRFLREAQAAAACVHDRIVAIHHVGEDRGLPFLTMPLLQGETLQARLERAGRPPVAEVVRIGREVAEGLTAAHERGLVHRDINPANIWLEGAGGRVKIMDFGLARAAEDGGGLTQPGTAMGTPPYIAPEQARGEAVDARSDLFALGCVLYRLATGRAPFRGADPTSLLTSLALDEPAPPRRLNPEVPPALDALVMQLLAKAPAGRPPSARAVADALAAIRPVPPTADRPRRPVRRRRLLAAALLLVAAGTLAAAIVIRIRNKDGTETTITLPEGSSVRVEQDGKVVATVPAEADKPAAPTGPLDRLDPGQIPAEERFTWQPKELVAVLGEHRGWHPNIIRGLAFSRDGKRVISCGNEGTVRLWDAATLRLQVELKGHTGGITALALSPDGQTLATASADQTVRLWSLGEAEPKVRAVLRRHTDEVAAVAFAPDGKTLASAGADKTIRLWDLAGPAPRERTVLDGQPGAVTSVAFGRDGRTLASAGPDQPVRLWELDGDSAKVRAELTGHGPDHAPAVVAFAPDGHTLASGGADRLLRLWDLSGEKPRERYVKECGDAVHTVAFSPDGQTVAAGNASGQVHLWDVGGREVRWRTMITSVRGWTYVNAVAFAPDSQTLAAGGADCMVKLWDLGGPAPQRLAVPRDGEDPMMALSFHPGGQALAVGCVDGSVRLWDLAGPRPQWQRSLPGQPEGVWSVAFAPDGRTLACWGCQGTAQLWDLTGTEPKMRANLPGTWGQGGVHLVFSPDGRRLATSHPGVGFKLWDLTGTEPKLDAAVAEPKLVECAAVFAPDGKSLAFGTDDGSVRLWDVSGAEPKERARVQGHTAWIHSVAFAPDGRTLASSSGDKTIRLWDLGEAEPKTRAVLQGHTNGMVVAFAADGQRLASAGLDGRLILWQAATGAKLHDWTLAGAAHDVAFAPDGRHLATAHANGTVYVLRLTEPLKK